MKHNFLLTALLSIIIMAVTSCSPQIELTASWANKQAKVKSSPEVMVMVLGSNLANRQSVEAFIVAELVKGGHKAIASLDVFKPTQKYDSLTMVNMLREKNVDMLLTNAVVDVTEKEHYVPGTTEQVGVSSYSNSYNPYYGAYGYGYGGYGGYGGYNNYYGYYNSYTTAYETRTTPGYTYTEVEVIIESKLFDVHNAELLWFGQSKSFTKEPSYELFDSFAKIVVGDITKNNLLVK